MNIKWMVFRLAILVPISLLTTCGSPKQRVILQEVKVYVTATPDSSESLNSPTPWLSTSVPPSPTPTAPSFREIDDISDYYSESPISQPGAPCGFVDYFDFPLDAPEGAAANGGTDYKIYRGRYGKFHTGEDWHYRQERNFRAPVYSVGHGVVTYAEPLGWGADQGVIILRHIFQDRSDVFSFYGHLDPPSVNLSPGDCVERGDWIGSIGNPRTSPHLHFEIRSHMPFGPGPGYWSTDPNHAGWFAPTSFIWSTRLKRLPVFQWENSLSSIYTEVMGTLGENSLAVRSGQEIISLDINDGSIEWRSVISNTIDAGILDHTVPILYTSDQLGIVTAYAVPDAPNNDAIPTLQEMLWQIDTDAVGIPFFIPLFDGGVLLSVYDHLIQLSPAGEMVWQQEQIGTLEDWVENESGFWFSTRGRDPGIWQLEGSGPKKLVEDVSGKLSFAEDTLYVYARDGLYTLPVNSNKTEKLVALTNAVPAIGDMLMLEDGAILLAHMDRDDRKLILINPAGDVEWERSYASITVGVPTLFQYIDRIFILNEHTLTNRREITLYEVGIESGEMKKVFVGGSRRVDIRGTWVYNNDNADMVININGGSIVGVNLALPTADL